MTPPFKEDRFLISCIALTLVLFVVDVLLPRSVAWGALYSIVILMSLRLNNPRLTLMLTGMCVLLMVPSYFVAPDSYSPTWAAIANRLMAMGLLLLTALLGLSLLEANYRILNTQRKLEEVNRELEHRAASDGLTGVSNRRHFDERLAQELQRAQREGEPVSLLLVDVDHFKRYNDTLGHLAGDECLVQIAQILQANVRRSTDVVSRYGGEEFAVILPNTDPTGAWERAEAIRLAVREAQIPCGLPEEGCVTASVGCRTVWPSLDSALPKTVIDLADQALYRAKRSGRDRVEREPQARPAPGPANCSVCPTHPD